jgi:hypothetical protein
MCTIEEITLESDAGGMHPSVLQVAPPWRKSFCQFMEFSMEFHEIFHKHLTNFFHYIFPWNSMENSMEFHGIQFDGIPSIDGF